MVSSGVACCRVVPGLAVQHMEGSSSLGPPPRLPSPRLEHLTSPHWTRGVSPRPSWGVGGREGGRSQVGRGRHACSGVSQGTQGTPH